MSPYEKHYSESGFWGKVKKLGKKVLEPALTLYYVMKADSTPANIKLLIALSNFKGYTDVSVKIQAILFSIIF